MKTIRHGIAAFALTAASFAASASSVWLSDNSGNLSRLDAATNQIAAQVSGVAPKDAAMLPDNSVWVLGQGHLRKFNAAAATLIDLSLQTDNLVGARVLARDRYSAQLWVADVTGSGSLKEVVQLDPQGGRLASFFSPGGIRAIAVDLDPTIWLLANSQLLHYSPNGVLLGSVDLSPTFAGNPSLMAVDAIRGIVWLAGNTQIASFDAHTLGSPLHVVTLPENSTGIDVDADTGALWVATLNGLRTYSSDATLLRTINTSALSLASPQTVAFDPATMKAWLGYTGGVASFGRDGTLSTNLTLGQTISRIVTTAFIPAPTVAITAPGNGTVIAAPGTFTVRATATELGAAIAKVEFFRGSTSIGAVTSPPYQVNATNLAAGAYSFTAVATDVHGTSTTSSAVGVTLDAPPTVSITAPANNTVVGAPATITITANAADSDGTIAKVDFYRGTTLFATLTSPPYAASAANLASGTYSFTAVATDNLGLSTTSAAISVVVDAPPTVSITSPVNNSIVTAPATVTLTANAADSDGTVAKVDFYQGTTLVGTATSAPYSVTVASLAAGSYTFGAKATDNVGLESALAIVSVLVNAPPTVSITAPANNAVVPSPATITITANAADSDGTVAKVDFYRGTTLLGTATTAPYSASAANLAAGTYTFTAVATDNLGASTTSAVVTVIVDTPPTVSFTSPANNSVVTAPATVTLVATAADSDGTVAKVEFYKGAALVGTVTSPPYSASVVNLAAGSYTFFAKATDNLGIESSLASVNVLVNAPPTVSITAPANNAVVPAPATVTVTASAADSDGTGAKVDFYRGTTLIATVTSPPYTTSAAGLASGTYTFTAVATDNLGASTTSAPVTVIADAPPTVSIMAPVNNSILTAPATVTLVASAADSDGTIAKVDFYKGTALVGTATSTPYSASVANLAAGSYTFAAKATDNLGIESSLASVNVLVSAPPTVSITAPANNTVVPAPATVTLTASAADSDGTVAKVEFYRGTALIATVTSSPYTTSAVGLASGTYSFTAVATDNLGASTTSAPVAVIVDAPPVVSITAPVNNAVLSAPGTVSLTATASDSDGSVAKVDFYQGATLVGTATAAPYSATVSNLAAGTYAFTAVATDDRGLATTSAPVSVIVNAPPSVAIISPADGAVFPAPATLTVTATASDSDGTITKVEFYRGSTLVGTATSPPYSATLSNVATGGYALTAKATDDRGAVTTSTAVMILVHAPPTIALTSPTNNASFKAPATIPLAATAAATDGAIAKVEFLQGATLLATVTAAPYTFSWTNVAQGTYTLTARATDDRGFVTTSSSVSVTVAAQLAIYYIHTDHLGTPRAITQSTDNQTIWRSDNTEPFGNSQPNQNPSGLGVFAYNLRFPGQYFDQETGTHFNWMRDYDPRIGRYIESDPIGQNGGLSTYGYVSGGPLSRFDVDGLAQVCYGAPVTFPHYWLCANGMCGGLVPGSGGEFGGQGSIRPQRPGTKGVGGDASTCSKVNDSGCDSKKLDECVADAIQNQRGNRTYHLINHNCMDWSWETLQQCRKEACKK